MVSSIALWDPKCVALSGLVSGGTGAVDGMDEAWTGGHFLGDARTISDLFRIVSVVSLGMGERLTWSSEVLTFTYS